MQASRQTYISASAELGNQGEVVSIKAIKAQTIACITYSSKGINVKCQQFYFAMPNGILQVKGAAMTPTMLRQQWYKSPSVGVVDQHGPPPPRSAPLHRSSRANACPTGNPINYRLSQRAKRTKKNQIHSYMVANLWLRPKLGGRRVASGLGQVPW